MKLDEFRKIQNDKEKAIKMIGNSNVLVKQAEINKCISKIKQQLDKHDFEEN